MLPLLGTPLQDWMSLARVNRHERDNHIHFDEPTHVYTVNGTYEGYCSITKFHHEFFGHFDADAVIGNMMRSKKWPQSQWFGMTPKQIKDAWAANGKEASEAGTAIHLAIEMYLNGSPETIPPAILDSIEWKYFTRYWEKDSRRWQPWRTEWEIWDDELLLAGSVDMVFKSLTDNTYAIYDWKRAKEIKMENPFQSGLGPLSHFPDCNYWQYTLQLNLYRWILEKHYGLKITELALIVLHPNNTSFKRFVLPILTDEIEDLLECRRAALRRGKKEIAYWE
jgi:hypothetical protein